LREYLVGLVNGKVLRLHKRKSPGEPGDLLCGWVSKYREIKFPYAILKIIFPI